LLSWMVQGSSSSASGINQQPADKVPPARLDYDHLNAFDRSATIDRRI
jgi:hypothetical protein